MADNNSTQKIIGQIQKAISQRQSEIKELQAENCPSACRLLTCKRASLSSLEWVLQICLSAEANADGWY